MGSSTNNPLPATGHRGAPLRGTITVPGDKSISHRALMFASQALGTTTVHGLLEGEDVLSTAGALRQCGVSIEKTGDAWVIRGVGIGGLNAPTDPLDMGNAGTAARLLMGLLAPYPFATRFVGDASLSKRPMRRVIAPLEQFGARFDTSEGDRMPLTMHGTAHPLPVEYMLPVASAQVKSAVLLAGLNTPGQTSVVEAEPTRDHTERMLRFFGVEVHETPSAQGTRITVTGQPAQQAQDRDFTVPADPSSAAFPVVAALLVPGSEVTVRNVCLNPTRTGLFDTLREMGADLAIGNQREVGGETVGDITARHSALHGVTVPAGRAPSMIDEFPILAMAAAVATGTTRMQGLSELRVKESDRLAAIVTGLKACGVDAHEDGDSMVVTGGAVPGGATVTTHYDHRIAMSFLILGFISAAAVAVDDSRAIATSFPNFMPLMHGLGASITGEPACNA